MTIKRALQNAQRNTVHIGDRASEAEEHNKE